MESVFELTKIPEYRELDEERRKAAGDEISWELRQFHVRAGGEDHRGRLRTEKVAVMPDLTAESLARAALQNLQK